MCGALGTPGRVKTQRSGHWALHFRCPTVSVTQQANWQESHSCPNERGAELHSLPAIVGCQPTLHTGKPSVCRTEFVTQNDIS